MSHLDWWSIRALPFSFFQNIRILYLKSSICNHPEKNTHSHFGPSVAVNHVDETDMNEFVRAVFAATKTTFTL